MADIKTVAVEEKNVAIKRQNQFVEVMKRLSKSKGAMVGLVIFLIVVLIAALGDVLAPYGYNDINTENAYIKPCLKHLFGTDNLGRDIFSRILVGAKYSLFIGIGAELFSLFFGVILGSLSGYFGGIVDSIIMRVCDVVQSVPGMILNVALSCVLGSGIIQTVIALGIGGISGCARMMRASILRVRKQEYLDAATSINCNDGRIIMKHVLPNAFSPLIVQMSMGVGGRILSAAGLSYLGLGVQPPMPEWGAMVTAGRKFMKSDPYMTVIPGLCIMVVVLALNLLGDGLRDALDPKLKK